MMTEVVQMCIKKEGSVSLYIQLQEKLAILDQWCDKYDPRGQAVGWIFRQCTDKQFRPRYKINGSS